MGIDLCRTCRSTSTTSQSGNSSSCRFISHRVFLKSFCKGQHPHQSVDTFFILAMMQDKLTDLWGNRLLQNASFDLDDFTKWEFIFMQVPAPPYPLSIEPGTHICVFYKTDFDVVYSFYNSGFAVLYQSRSSMSPSPSLVVGITKKHMCVRTCVRTSKKQMCVRNAHMLLLQNIF